MARPKKQEEAQPEIKTAAPATALKATPSEEGEEPKFFRKISSEKFATYEDARASFDALVKTHAKVVKQRKVKLRVRRRADWTFDVCTYTLGGRAMPS